ncbi:glycosyltransferase [Pseudodesulfovibrio sp. F-1]|uniref:Glycosyltransferase n=1 Tax=Pseudodesulfovibrio alkaliphilus TaxID=2661613 RepID=A0A7K1KM21_9BACT|nr:glycosyltransferase [Pseudodesulfovibrio alkaliphilus]MUM77138.1 glycosyltransferase [Pseudodesulfovibrio alkaliphilus]
MTDEHGAGRPGHGPIAALWDSLPEPLKHKLLPGFTGKRHLLDVAGWCLRSGNPGLTPVAVDAVRTAFGENPLDGAMAKELLAVEPLRQLLPEPTRRSLAGLASLWRRPESIAYYHRLLARRDFERTLDFIEQSAAREPENLFWREQAVAMGLVGNAPDRAESVALAGFPSLPEMAPLKDCAAARILAFRGRGADAARLYRQTADVFGPAFAGVGAGLALLAEGDRASASLLLIGGLRHAPWNTSLLLRLYDLLAGHDEEVRPLGGSVAVLLYSWNKAVELDATLRSLLQSELAGASLFVLDNGSTDGTAEVLRSWQTRFDSRLGPGRFTVLTLPVNIGAPAARNWLMRLQAVARHDFACYLDDDVEIPSDWLLRLGAAVHHYPEAGVWGCKVVDHANGALIQSADSHLLVDEDGPPPDLSRLAPNPFRLSDLHIQTLDCGLLDILRPCASVTGCCHLFRTRDLLEVGDFAIHLSPSQYDDMERDLRLCEAGRFPVYQGHLGVRHRKRTGAASRVSDREEGNALGNKYKMQTMHERSALVAAMHAERALLDADLWRKLGLVERALLG